MGDLHSRYERGNLVFYDTHRKRIVDAIGADITKYIDDFTDGSATDTTVDADWTATRVEAGAGESTLTRVDGVGGILRITTDAADNDGINAQLIGESFKLALGSIVYFGIRLKMSESTQSDFFAGLAITDTDILGGVTDSIGFRKVDASTQIVAVVNKNSTETTANVATCDTSYHTYEFYYDGASSLEFFVDGVSVATPAITNLPDDEELRVSLHVLTGEAVSHFADADWIRCVQIGGRQ